MIPDVVISSLRPDLRDQLRHDLSHEAWQEVAKVMIEISKTRLVALQPFTPDFQAQYLMHQHALRSWEAFFNLACNVAATYGRE